MSAAVKMRGRLVFDDQDALDELLQLDEEDEVVAEVAEFISGGISLHDDVLLFDLDGELTNEGNLEFQGWIGDLAEAASDGSIDTWQESFGEAMFVRVLAGGEEVEVAGPFVSKEAKAEDD